MEEVKMLKDSVQQETEEKNRLQAIITDKDVWLERAVADTDRLKTQLAEKEEQVGWGLVFRQCSAQDITVYCNKKFKRNVYTI